MTMLPQPKLRLIPHHNHQVALDVASKGYPVFPCRPDTRSPCHSGWQQESTTDPAKINWLWQLEYGALPGIDDHCRLRCLGSAKATTKGVFLRLSFIVRAWWCPMT
jgi:hypothetical protein